MNKYRGFDNYLKEYPDERRYFGEYSGNYPQDPELVKALEEYAEAYNTIAQSAQFIVELRRIRKDFQGRPIPVYHCQRLSQQLGRTQIYLKREDLNHTGAYKFDHCMGEGLLARYMGKKGLTAETEAGQYGVVLATAAAYFGLECDIYMGEVDIAKQAPNVARIKVLGTRIIPVSSGLKTLREAVDVAFTTFSREYHEAIYHIGTAVGPHPFSAMVRDLQEVVGTEVCAQFLEQTRHLLDKVAACVDGGSNVIGMFVPFLADPIETYGVEPLGRGRALEDHAAMVTFGGEGVTHGFGSIMLSDASGQPASVYSSASGLDYPSVGPEHSLLHDLGCVNYVTTNDKQAIEALFLLSRLEGIIPAIEGSYTPAYAICEARIGKTGSILMNLSRRGDKSLDLIIKHYGTGEKYVKLVQFSFLWSCFGFGFMRRRYLKHYSRSLFFLVILSIVMLISGRTGSINATDTSQDKPSNSNK